MQIYGIEICKVHKPSRDSQRVIARNRFYWLVFVLQLVAKWRFKFIIDVPYRPPLLLIYINGRSQVRFSNQSILIRHFLLANCMQLNKRSSTIANSTNGWSRKKTHVHLFLYHILLLEREERGKKKDREGIELFLLYKPFWYCETQSPFALRTGQFFAAFLFPG